jgi:hypothetical protein
VSLLVVITSPGTNDAVAISATASGAKITDMSPAQLKPGVVGEVWLVPDATTVDAVDSPTSRPSAAVPQRPWTARS